MILVDTSVWIELLNRKLGERLSADDLLLFCTCGPAVQEVLQGLREDRASEAFLKAFLALPRIGDPVQVDTYVHAAELYTLGRKKVYTIRSSVDCLIAAIAIENRTPVWHRDRNFTAIAKYTSLDVYDKPEQFTTARDSDLRQ